jgi:PAS domain S-box-containing protein
MQGLEINFSDNIRLASRKMAFIGFILVGMATLLLGLIGGRFQYSIIRNISLGITELIEVTNKISNDQLDFKILYSVKDEIGTLAQAFMEMGQRLKGAKSQIVKAELNLDKSEKKLSESSQAFNELMSALSHSAIISKTDIEGRMNYINKKYIDISGYLETELIGQNHKLLSSGKHNPDFFKELWATILDSKVWQGTICNKKKDGSFYWLSTTIIPSLLDNKIIGFLSICSDVTAEVNAKNQLAHSARLSALGEMAGGIAHEINTPLGALRMMVERVIRLNQKGQVDSENSIADGQKMLKVVDRMAVIVNGMRRLSRSGENDNFVKVSAQQFVEDALGLCQEKFKNYGIDIRTKMSANFEILCRSVEISQVIINLLNNSFKALSKLEEKWIEIAFDANEQFALIRVTDSGKGLEAKVKERLMQPFFTTGEIGEGLGIGLNISYKIVQEHGGVLYYDDSVQNTCFVIKLPIRKPENISKASA